MPNSITQAFVNQFRDNIRDLYQQEGSMLRSRVMEEPLDGELKFFERLGPVAAVVKTGRHSDTPILDVDHSRRAVIAQDFVWATLIDREDLLRTLVNPQSNYVRQAGWALGRTMDDIIIGAALGPAKAGKDGSLNVLLPAGQMIPDGGTNLTVAKLRQASRIFNENEVPVRDRHCAITAAGVEALLGQTEFTSIDFNTQRTLVDGATRIMEEGRATFMGFNFVMTERLPKDDATGIHTAVCWHRFAIGHAVARDITTRIDERIDKNYAMQVWAAMSSGAVRLEEEGVVTIDYDINA